MSRVFKCKIFDDEQLCFHYPKGLNVTHEPEYIVFGSKVVKTACSSHPDAKNTISISSKLAEELSIPPNLTALRLFLEEESIHLGPLIGIFSSGFTPLQTAPIGNRTACFEKLLKTHSSSGAVPFLFGAEHIDWENGSVNGYFFLDHKWIQLKTPLPSVIHDHLPSKQSESMERAKTTKDKLVKEYMIPWKNTAFLRQLDLFERLYNDQRTEAYLPETITFTSFSEVERMLVNYGHVFIKHINENAEAHSKQIIYDRADDHYYCRFFGSKERLLKFNSLESLMKYAFKGQSFEKLYVQQGIRLIQKDKRPVEFLIRATKQNGDKEWKVKEIKGNLVGSKEKISSSTNDENEYMLKDIFLDHKKLQHHTSELEKMALDTASAIHDNLSGIVDDIELTIGIDQGGSLWVIKISLPNSYEASTLQPAFL